MTAPLSDEPEATQALPAVDEGPPDIGALLAESDSGTDTTPDPAAVDPNAPPADPAPPTWEDFPLQWNNQPVKLDGVQFNPKTFEAKFADEIAFKRFQTMAKHGYGYQTQYRTENQAERTKLHKEYEAKLAEVEATRTNMQGIEEGLQAFLKPQLTEQEALGLVQAIRDAYPAYQQQRAAGEVARLKAELEAARNPASRTPDAAPLHPDEVEELTMDAQSAIKAKLQDVAASGQVAWMTPEAHANLVTVLTDAEFVGRVVRQATPAERAQGAPNGWLIDWNRIDHEVQRLAPAWQTALAAKTTAAKQLHTMTPVARENAAILAKGNPPAAQKSPVPSPRRSAPTPRQQKDADLEELNAQLRDAMASMS